MISLLPMPPSLYFLFLTFSLFFYFPRLAFQSWSLAPLPSCNFKADFLVYQHSPFTHSGSGCVFLLLFPSSHLALPHTLLYCVSYKNMHNGSQSLILGAECCCHQGKFFISWKPLHIFLHVKNRVECLQCYRGVVVVVGIMFHTVL